jgi:hypothetical protein
MSYADVRHWCEERDDEPEPVGRHACEPPHSVVVIWMEPVEYDDVFDSYDPRIDAYVSHVFRNVQAAPVGRWFPAERWARKHALAFKAAMERRHGHAWIEVEF